MKVRKVAIHEAGHAVIGYALGLQFSMIEIALREGLTENNSYHDNVTRPDGLTHFPVFIAWAEETRELDRKPKTINEIKNIIELDRWFSNFVNYTCVQFAGPIAQYYSTVECFEALPVCFWDFDTLDEGVRWEHMGWIKELLKFAQKSERLTDYILPSFIGDNIEKAEELVQTNWNTIVTLAEVLIDSSPLLWHEALEIIG